MIEAIRPVFRLELHHYVEVTRRSSSPNDPWPFGWAAMRIAVKD
jgi:hypothetical protein